MSMFNVSIRVSGVHRRFIRVSEVFRSLGAAFILFSLIQFAWSDQAHADQSDTARWQGDFSVSLPETGDAGTSLLNQMTEHLRAVGITPTISFDSDGSARLSLSGSKGTQELRSVLFNTPIFPLGLISGPIDMTLSGETNGGQLLTIDLESNPSTGYRWKFVGAEAGDLQLESDSIISRNTLLVGSPVTQRLTIRSMNGGLATAKFAYRRSWEEPLTQPNAVSVDMATFNDHVDLTNPNQTADANQIVQSNIEVGQGPPLVGLPSSFDWRSQGLTPIKDQGQCGSCWAFGTVGVLESALMVWTNTLTDLSEQFLVSCNKDTWGCDGGFWAHDYHESELGQLQTIPGAVLEVDMPYTSGNTGQNGTCQPIANHPYQIASWTYISYGSATPDAIKSAIYTYGPVGTTVCVGNAFQSYTGGVFSTDESSQCPQGNNHAVVLVGWNDADQTWILRNSWGTYWGEDGYMNITYGTSNVGYYSTYVVLSSAYTLTVASTNPSGGVNITVSPNDANGQGNGTTQFTRTYSQGTSVTLTPPASSSSGPFSSWSGCDSTSSTQCTVSMTANRTVTANYTSNAYSIISTAGTGGTISPSGTTTVNYGASQKFTITPSNYYGIQDVQVDGTSVGAVSQYTFTNVTSNHTIAVTFVLTDIAVTSPNGGEQWVPGSTHTISWIYKGKLGSYVKIELLESGVVVGTLSTKNSMGSGGQGSYSWTITQQPATDYQIRVTSTSNGAYSDVSNATFSIIAPSPTITVTAPNGGESWSVGTTQAITWQYASNPGSTVTIDLYNGGVFYANIASGVPIGSNGTGSYSWSIPSTQATGSGYTVKITSNTGYADSSNGPFSITNTPPPPAVGITVTAPNGGETWSRGSTQVIKWTYTGNPGASVKIALYEGGGLSKTLTASTSIGSGGNGSFSWRIPTKLTAGTNYEIMITSTSNASYSDTSDNNFTIK